MTLNCYQYQITSPIIQPRSRDIDIPSKSILQINPSQGHKYLLLLNLRSRSTLTPMTPPRSLSLLRNTHVPPTNLARPSNTIPLSIIVLCVGIVCRDTLHLILGLLLENQIENQRDERGDGETGLHDQLNGVEESAFSAVAARVGEHVGEPVWDQG